MEPTKPQPPKTLEVPSTEGWPLVAAFGVTLLWAGLLTHWMVSALGALCLVGALVSWFREVLPKEYTARVAVEPEPDQPTTRYSGVRHLQVGEQGHRARLPLVVRPYSAGLRGGLVGGAVMAVLAVLYGIIAQRSVWYPINLLAAAGSADLSAMSTEQLRQFSGWGLFLATVIHVMGSALIGLLYGIALPMFPRHPVLFGGILAPLVWTGLLHSGMGIINPALQARVDWFWFVLAQMAFGCVAGLVVARHEPISTLQFVPFATRAGIESQDTEGPNEGNRPQ